MVLLAAAKYAAPPLGVKNCVVAFDTGYPKSTKNGNNWKVEAMGKYNYDDSCAFKKLELYMIYTKGAMSFDGQSWAVTDEKSLGTPGTFSVTFNDVTPPPAGYVLTMTARITVTCAGVDDSDSHAKNVDPP